MAHVSLYNVTNRTGFCAKLFTITVNKWCFLPPLYYKATTERLSHATSKPVFTSVCHFVVRGSADVHLFYSVQDNLPSVWQQRVNFSVEDKLDGMMSDFFCGVFFCPFWHLQWHSPSRQFDRTPWQLERAG